MLRLIYRLPNTAALGFLTRDTETLSFLKNLKHAISIQGFINSILHK